MATRYNPDTVSHPGETLREKLKEMKMSPKEFAVRCDKPEKTISAVLNGKSSLTAEMAVQFEDVTKISASFWLKRQYRFSEARARAERQQAAEDARDWARQFPYADMAKKGWVPATRNVREKAVALFAFFAVSSHKAWQDFYLNKELKAAFRVSLIHSKSPHAISAWLRSGDNAAQKLTAKPYSDKKLKAALPELKAIMAEQPEDFFLQVQQVCLAAGLKIVFTPCLPKAPINGVARWIEKNQTPLIQLSARYKRYDTFWFSLFHEIGHILLHGKKEVFLEDVKYEGADEEKEREADYFACGWTLTKAQEREVLSALPLSDKELRNYAAGYGTHPSLIVGRLRHLEIIGHYEGKEFFPNVNWALQDC